VLLNGTRIFAAGTFGCLFFYGTGEMDQHTGEPETDFQATDTQLKFRYKNGISGKLSFERVNEITWKLTDGTMTNVPASHGQWRGYRTSKAIAWVIDVGVNRPAWIARFKDQCTNPLPLKEAKAAAMTMAKKAPGDYSVANPIAHMNGLAARLIDLEV
jgi:hypothetical protein